jgi:N-acetylneuraminate synthase
MWGILMIENFITAELSGNHNGEMPRAKQLIKLAYEAGTDAVKLQTYTADTITLNSN